MIPCHFGKKYSNENISDLIAFEFIGISIMAIPISVCDRRINLVPSSSIFIPGPCRLPCHRRSMSMNCKMSGFIPNSHYGHFSRHVSTQWHSILFFEYLQTSKNNSFWSELKVLVFLFLFLFFEKCLLLFIHIDSP